jgi:hypothetical protein
MVQEQPFVTNPHPPHYREGEPGPSGHNLRHQHHTYHEHESDEENTSFQRSGHFERSVADLIERCEVEEARWQRIHEHPAHAERHFYSVFAEEDEYIRLSSDDHEQRPSEQWHHQLQLTTTEDLSQQQEVTAHEHVHLEVDAIVLPAERPEHAAERIARQDAHVRGVTRARVAQHRQDRQDPQHIQFGAALNLTQSLMSGTMVVPLFRLGQRQACTNCGALLFMHERSWGHLCCMKGQVVLPTIQEQLPVSNVEEYRALRSVKC